jgi:hypothetical protein
MWFVGSAIMGALYDRSITALVSFGLVLQLAAAVAFFWLRGRVTVVSRES